MFNHRLFGKMERSLLMGILFLLLLSLFIRSTWAAEPQRLQRDLGVMEDVLESLCAHTGDQQTAWGSGPQARGLYLKGYGLLFLVEGCLSSSSPENVLVSVVRKEGGQKVVETKNGRHIVKVIKKEDPDGGETEDPQEKARELIVEFLGNYGDITNQLPEGERITVLLRPGGWHLMLPMPLMPPMPPLPPLPVAGDFEFDLNFQSAENIEQLTRKVEEIAEKLRESGVISDSVAGRLRLEVEQKIKEQKEKEEDAEGSIVFKAPNTSSPVIVHQKISHDLPQTLLAATVKKSDIVAYRQGELTEAQFRQRIDFQEHDLRSQETKSVDIMAGILDKALDGETHHRRQGGTLGIYQKGLGALFFVEKEAPSDLFAPFHDRENHKDEQRRYLDRLRKQLFDAVADYGSTLRPVQPDEYVIVELRFSSGFISRSAPSRLILRARKEDINAYQQGKIDLDKFRQKSELQEL
jgi:hypothetical protein